MDTDRLHTKRKSGSAFSASFHSKIEFGMETLRSSRNAQPVALQSPINKSRNVVKVDDKPLLSSSMSIERIKAQSRLKQIVQAQSPPFMMLPHANAVANLKMF